jgi:hypothetical protein
MNAIQEEYISGMQTLGFPGMVYYKYLSMFSVKVSKDDSPSTVSFGTLTPVTLDTETASTLRSYIKQQKEWLREEQQTNKAELRRRIWWIVQKILDYKLFTEKGQCYMMYWLDKCDDQLLD